MVGSLAASPEGDQVAAGRADGTITLYDLPGLDAGTVLRGASAAGDVAGILAHARRAASRRHLCG